MVFPNKMAYPGLTFAILVGVAIGTAIYYYFNQENNQQQRQNTYYPDGNHDYDYDYNAWTQSKASSSGSQRRKRRNSSSKCSICLEEIETEKMKTITECGHEFHVNCITKWFLQSKSCPICRQTVSS